MQVDSAGSNMPMPASKRTCAAICDTPASSLRAAAAAMRGVVVYSRKFQMKLQGAAEKGGWQLVGSPRAYQ